MISKYFVLLYAPLVLAADPPKVDLHIHLHGEDHNTPEMKPADAAVLSRKMGVGFGILAEGGCRGDIHDNKTLGEFLGEVRDQPLWRGLQVYGFDWSQCLSADLRGQLDYIAADALVFPDKTGKSIWLWLPNIEVGDPQDFMDRYVAFNERVLSQPIQIWANPTYIPEKLKARYAELWTPARMDRLIQAAVRNHVAIEINAHFQVPSAAFIRRAKAAGAKFSFGSNSHVNGMGEIDFCLRMAEQCGLTDADIYVPSRRLAR